MEFFFDRSEQVNYSKVRYEFFIISLNPNFQRVPAHASQVFLLQKFKGAQILTFFGENWHETRTNAEIQIRNLTLKSTNLDP